jgi:hypothetical protein
MRSKKEIEARLSLSNLLSEDVALAQIGTASHKRCNSKHFRVLFARQAGAWRGIGTPL